jgi:hypothetical protein
MVDFKILFKQHFNIIKFANLTNGSFQIFVQMESINYWYISYRLSCRP